MLVHTRTVLAHQIHFDQGNVLGTDCKTLAA